MKKQLPQLSSLMPSIFLTIGRSKDISASGIHLSSTFRDVTIDAAHLKSFRQYFGFRTDVPLSYLYTMAQRAQAALMLDKAFKLPIPGMVHLGNQLEKKAEPDPDIPFDITISAQVDYKESGSLKPVFLVELSQNGQVVTVCKSLNLIKRKSKTKKHKKVVTAPQQQTTHEAIWKYDTRTGKEYANVSGDKNPIHTSLIFARIMGFGKSIMHGWYSVCKVEQYLEENEGLAVSEIDSSFLSPILLPSQARFVLQKGEKGVFNYQLLDDASEKILLNGMMK